MNRWKNKQTAYFIFLLTAIFFFGCSPKFSYQVMSFFFDGVPNNYKNEITAVKDSSGKVDTANLKPLSASTKPEVFLHSPFAEHKCNKCHTEGGGKPLLPLPQLCYQCHEPWNNKYAVLHGPVASGYCLKCHNQHEAKVKKLLLREGQDICLYCHNKAQVMQNKNHSEIGNTICTKCHNPHGGENRFVLKNIVEK